MWFQVNDVDKGKPQVLWPIMGSITLLQVDLYWQSWAVMSTAEMFTAAFLPEPEKPQPSCLWKASKECKGSRERYLYVFFSNGVFLWHLLKSDKWQAVAVVSKTELLLAHGEQSWESAELAGCAKSSASHHPPSPQDIWLQGCLAAREVCHCGTGLPAQQPFLVHQLHI